MLSFLCNARLPWNHFGAFALLSFSAWHFSSLAWGQEDKVPANDKVPAISAPKQVQLPGIQVG
ncbi:MAG: hypothetical protein RLY14_2259, partial [Planctomycetota bacterium]